MAHALDLVGERWALLVVRELLLGPKRFTDLRRGLPAASPNALTDRLRELVEIGVVRRRRLPPPAASWVYELTEWGRELDPILTALGTWALRSSLLDPSGHLSTDSVMLTIRTYWRPGPATVPTTLQVVLTGEAGEDRFGVQLSDRGADARHDLPPRPDATVTGDPAALTAVLGAPDRLGGALATGTLRLSGDRAAVARLVGGMQIPDPAPVEARR
jgi:DNA-binding HxlR family transcriptional regulator